MLTITFLRDKSLLEAIPVHRSFITEFMPEASELAVKAYLYGLMLTFCPSGECDIAGALNASAEDICAAFSYWEWRGLVRVVSEEPLQIRYLDPRTAADGGDMHADAQYAEFVKKLQGILGTRMLSGSELGKIYDWMDVFGLEQDAAIEIVKRCLDTKGTRVSVSYMDAVARTVAGGGNLTKEAVGEYFSKEDMLRSGAAAILKRLNKRRMPTEDELALYEKWTVGWGFEHSAIEMACAQMTAAGNPSFKYLDSVLDTWRAGGALNARDIVDMQKQDDIICELAREAFARAGIRRKPTAEDRLIFREWAIERCVDRELIFYAAELSADSRYPFARMKQIVGEWLDAGISSLAAARSFHEAYRKSTAKRSGSKVRPDAFRKNGAYTRDELKGLGISLGEEFYNDDEDQ